MQRVEQAKDKNEHLLDILMLGVDNVGQILAFDLLLKDPHLDLLVEMRKVLDIAAHDTCHGRSPAAM